MVVVTLCVAMAMELSTIGTNWSGNTGTHSFCSHTHTHLAITL